MSAAARSNAMLQMRLTVGLSPLSLFWIASRRVTMLESVTGKNVTAESRSQAWFCVQLALSRSIWGGVLSSETAGEMSVAHAPLDAGRSSLTAVTQSRL